MVQEICLLLLKGSALYFIGVNSIYGLLLLVSWLKIKQFNQNEKNEPNNDLPSVSFLVPAYNEETLIVETLQTYLSLPQENKEIIIVNDGSHDQTMRLLQVMYQLKKTDDPSGRLYQSITQPNLKVVEASHGQGAGT